MGSIMGKAMEENFKKQQDFMLENQRDMLERNMQMQNFMREQQMAMQIARARDVFHFFAAFYGTALFPAISGFIKTRKPAMIAPFVPLTFILAYQGDMAYGNKMHRIRADAQSILGGEQVSLLDLPSPLPSVEVLDARRAKAKSS